MNENILLGLGTNLGERVSNLEQAVNLISRIIKILEISPVYQTEPWGYKDQPVFLNLVLLGETTIQPHLLLKEIKHIELTMGREPTFHYGPRMIDIDILFYGDLIVDLKNLIIPHPHLHQRAFVLIPLADIVPDFIHPVKGLTVAEMLKQVEQNGVTRYPSELLWRTDEGSAH